MSFPPIAFCYYVGFFFLNFICFWVFTVFTSTQDTSQISTCINLHYTTLLHKENTTTLDYENKRKEKKKKKEKKTKKKEASRIDINNKLVQLLFYQLKEGFPFVVMDLKFIILSGYKTFYLKRTLNSFEKGFKG